MANNQKHQELVDCILYALGSTVYARVWPVTTGVGHPYGQPGKIISFGLKGQGDISGILCNGKRIEIEVKTGAGRLTTEQKNFRDMILKFGGVHVEARCVKDVIDSVIIALDLKAETL